MIINRTKHPADEINHDYCISIGGDTDAAKDAIYLDLEHYIYKEPKCVGVFGVCWYNKAESVIETLQYMVQCRKDSRDILYAIRDFFKTAEQKYIITFAGDNDFHVINSLFKKNRISIKLFKRYQIIDLQRMYLNDTGNNTSLKSLEKTFEIERQGELVSGQNLSKTFARLINSPSYGHSISPEKSERILNYNRQDVINLFKLSIIWNKYVNPKQDEEKLA